MLPLIGRIADLRGRVPVLVAALVIFALGSLVTALAYDMPSMVAGRFLQGLGGGGLVPATLALVADLYPVQRRAVPLGDRLGGAGGRQRARPALRRPGPRRRRLAGDLPDQPRRSAWSSPPRSSRRWSPAATSVAETPVDNHPSRPLPDLIGALLLLIALVAGASVFIRPSQLLRDLTWGQLFIPFAGDGRWLTPIGAVAIGGGRCCSWSAASTARRPLVDLPELVAEHARGRPARRASTSRWRWAA